MAIGISNEAERFYPLDRWQGIGDLSHIRDMRWQTTSHSNLSTYQTRPFLFEFERFRTRLRRDEQSICRRSNALFILDRCANAVFLRERANLPNVIGIFEQQLLLFSPAIVRMRRSAIG